MKHAFSNEAEIPGENPQGEHETLRKIPARSKMRETERTVRWSGEGEEGTEYSIAKTLDIKRGNIKIVDDCILRLNVIVMNNCLKKGCIFVLNHT